MIESRRLIFALLSAIFFSCAKDSTDEVVLESAGETLRISLRAEGDVNYIQCFANDSLTDSWPLRYPVFKIIKGDINNDGAEDIAVGVIKSTRRDSVVRKRLFIYQIRNRSIIPLWLGSSLSHPLEDFAVIQNDSITLVRSVEMESSGHYLVAEYEWFGFGLSFRKYLQRGLSHNNALELLDK
jgi:hypothetical protein